MQWVCTHDAGMGMQLQQLEQFILHDRVPPALSLDHNDKECCNGAAKSEKQPASVKAGAQIYHMSGPTLSEGNVPTVSVNAGGSIDGSGEDALYLVGSRRTAPGLPGLFATVVLEREGEKLRLGPLSLV